LVTGLADFTPIDGDKLWAGKWVAKFGSAPAYYGSSLGSNPDDSQKYKMGDIGKKGGQPALPRPKKYLKKGPACLSS
jgi:hypothetical protein